MAAPHDYELSLLSQAMTVIPISLITWQIVVLILYGLTVLYLVKPHCSDKSLGLIPFVFVTVVTLIINLVGCLFILS
ncbi:hypothetical protein E4T25_04225 [Photobacterium damselae subsp. piscicida]|uniref:hypothetical protein n=1 Tax=Photobacterium damselae TaxID=38293 RepID=UPI0010768420|nr:hypothetical protein [Photobacterium damselae]TFZ62409.1 hypothetical protein E4T25_04225 [Photobacterium damselae subsp. piscicida]